MQEAFNRIYQEYTKRKSRLLMEGAAQRTTSHGYWASSEPMQILELFRKMGLKRFGHLVDLGSGDGVVVAIASLFTHATGIEADQKLHDTAEEMRDKLGLSYDLVNADYLDADLSGYDIIFISPDNYFHKLEKKLVDEFRGTLIIADNIFRPLTLTPTERISVRGMGFSVYKL